jgi:hypothetical protein
MPRLSAVRPAMSAEFEEKFRKILKRVYRTLQQFEIREEVGKNAILKDIFFAKTIICKKKKKKSRRTHSIGNKWPSIDCL